MNLTSVKEWKIPEGNVKSVSVNGVTLWSSDPAPSVNYFYFEAKMDTSRFALKKFGNPGSVSLEYSRNGSTWTPLTVGEDISIGDTGDRVYLRGNNATFSTANNDYYYFDVIQVKCGGSIMTLMDKTDTLRVVPDYAFCNLFRNAFISTPPELPATTVGSFGYAMMFYWCYLMTDAPVLPATQIGAAGYSNMFYSCQRITSLDVAFTAWGEHMTDNWLDGVPETGTFRCPAALPDVRGVSNIPTGWTRETR